jgi:hypothetical protein
MNQRRRTAADILADVLERQALEGHTKEEQSMKQEFAAKLQRRARVQEFEASVPDQMEFNDTKH